MNEVVDMLNFVAIEMLEQFGNNAPTAGQIDMMEELLSTTFVKKKIVFNKHLTQQEAMCLLLAAHGKSINISAHLLRISPATVVTYRKRICQKLKVNSLAQAVFQGMRYGLISSAA